ncbi:GNAT family N-acetyltransferase [Fusobacterium perfoetens]|uniref:GNAT family N-acetyltransferase n=1 Tax=Fusobacterium perfoetens TaxID=852 RepID=UPI0004868DF5|nr:N-acetyltransferase [Fusobacterium perfoetens]
MNIVIRKEEEKDYRRVEEIAREAFWNLYFPGAKEHVIVNKIRKSQDFIKDLTYVIEVDNQVEGGIFYSNSKIIGKNQEEYEVISFGPVFISPKFHRQGLGRKLITYTIEKAKEMGYRAIITLGYPYHYETYGFLGGKKYNIYMEDGKFYKGLLVLPLYEDALKNISGYPKFSKDLEATEEEMENFDKNFPYKEKKFQESQKEFEKACVELDE